MRIDKILQKYKDPTEKSSLFAYHYVMRASVDNDCFYKEVRAYNAFFHSAHGRHWKHDKFFFKVCDPNYEFDNPPRDHKIPEYRHLSIFDFFIHIGYNNKNKKFESNK